MISNGKATEGLVQQRFCASGVWVYNGKIFLYI